MAGDIRLDLNSVVNELNAGNQILSEIASALSTIAGQFTTTSGGSFTLSAAASLVVSNTSVASGSKIVLTPTNSAAATLTGSNAALYVSAKTGGASFTVSTASGASASGTETFDYMIFNT